MKLRGGYSGPRNQDTGLRYAEANFEETRDVEAETEHPLAGAEGQGRVGGGPWAEDGERNRPGVRIFGYLGSGMQDCKMRI